MKKTKLSALFALCLAITTFAPAMADGDENLQKVVYAELLITRTGGAGVAFVVGTPICATRRMVSRYKSFTQTAADKVGGKIGGKDSGPACAVVSLVTIPAAILVGTGEGIYYSGKNSYSHGFNEPYSAASFSVTEGYKE